MQKKTIQTVIQHKKKSRILILLIFICILALMFAVNRSLKPLINTLAVSKAETIATTKMSEAVTGVLEKENISYSDLVNISCNADGLVTSIKIDSIKANQLKAKLSAAIAESLASVDRKQISIPIGTITGIDFLAGRGPVVRLYINLSGSTKTEIVSEFSTAGINQVCHRIDLKITANIYIIMAGQNASAQVENDVNLAETVIVGMIPEIYAGANDEIWTNLIG